MSAKPSGHSSFPVILALLSLPLPVTFLFTCFPSLTLPSYFFSRYRSSPVIFSLPLLLLSHYTCSSVIFTLLLPFFFCYSFSRVPEWITKGLERFRRSALSEFRWSR